MFDPVFKKSLDPINGSEFYIVGIILTSSILRVNV